MKRKIYISFILFFFIVTGIISQPVIEWEKSFGGNNQDVGYKSLLTSDYLFMATSGANGGDVSGNHGGFDFWIFNTDSSGNIQWQKNVGGTGQDVLENGIRTFDFGYIFIGRTTSNNLDVSGNHGSDDNWLVKTDSMGNILWQKCFGGSLSEYSHVNNVIQLPDSGYIISGTTESIDGDVTFNNGTKDTWIIKTDKNGILIWQKCYGGTSEEYGNCIIPTLDGGFIIASDGSSINGDMSGLHGGIDAWIVKIDYLGTIQWQKCFGGTSTEFNTSIIQTNDGGFVIVSATRSNDGDVSGNHGESDIWLAKLNSNGIIQWQKCYGGTAADWSNGFYQTSDQGFIIVGGTVSNDGDVNGNHGGWDWWAIKTDSIGNLQWQKCFGGSLDEEAYSVTETPERGYIITGYSYSNDGDVTNHHGSTSYTDCWVVKLASDTTLICSPLNNSLTNGNQNAIEFSSVSFSITILGTAPTFQWEELIPGGFWQPLISGGNVVGAESSILTLNNCNLLQNNNQYRCIVSNSCPSSLTSTPQTLTVSSACIPVSGGATNGNQSVITPASATFTVSVLGTSPAYQWQQLIPAGTWTNLTSGPNVTGETTASMMLSNTNISQTNYQYRCIVSNSCPSSLTSTPQSLTVSSACIPVSGGATNGNQSVFSLASATFIVSVLGTSPNYQWQQLIPAGSWTNLSAGPNVSGVTSSILILSNTSTSLNNHQYRCIVTNSCPSSLTSVPQILTVVNNPVYWIGFFTKVENNEGLNWEKLIAQGNSTTSSPTPTKICADGSKATKIQVTCDDPTVDMNNIKFRIAGFSNSLEDGNFLSGDYNSSNSMAKVSYSHPVYVAPSTMFDSKIIEVYNQNNPTVTLLSYPINIYRAPVLMVHGLWGNLKSFEDMEDYLSNSNAYPHTWGSFDNSPLLFRIDYEESNDFSFGYNSQRVPTGINSILFNARDENYSAGKVIVVAHSMGGILTRLYFENLYGNIYRGDIQKFITLNTPHAGSQGADMLWFWNYGWCPATRFFMTPFPPRTGCPDAIENLRTNSSDMNSLNMISNLSLNLIPTYAIATEDPSLSDYQNCQTLIDDLISPIAWNNSIADGDEQLYMDNLYSGESTDLIVPVSSQEGNIGQTQTFSDQCHLNSPSNPQIIAKVLDLIDSPPTSSFFDVNGFVPTTLSAPSSNYFRTLNRSNSYSVEISYPLSGLTFNAGSTISINTIGDNSTKFLSLYVGNKIISDFTQTSNFSTNSFTYSIPSEAFGKLLIEIIGVDSLSNMSFDTVSVNINTPATLDSMTFYPPIHYISKSDSRMTRITGHFSDGIDRDISQADGLSIFSSDTNIASIRSSNFILANDTGHATLNYSFQSISKSMDVFTYEGEPWLTTNINETQSSKDIYNSQITNKVLVYPNPSSGMITLMAKELENSKAFINIYDISGQELFVNEVAIKNEILLEEINVSGIPAGVYLISVNDGRNKYFNRLIKE